MLLDNEEKRLMNYIVDNMVHLKDIRRSNFYQNEIWKYSIHSLKAKCDMVFEKKFN